VGRRRRRAGAAAPGDGRLLRAERVGADLWRLLAESPAAEEDLVGRLVGGYLVEPSLAAADVRRFLADLEGNGLVTVER